MQIHTQLFDLRAVCRGNNELFLVPWNTTLKYLNYFLLIVKYNTNNNNNDNNYYCYYYLNIIVYDLTENTVTGKTLFTFHVYWFHLNAHVKLNTGTCG